MESTQQSSNPLYIVSPDKGASSGSNKKRVIILLIVLGIAIAIGVAAYLVAGRSDDIDATKPVHTITLEDNSITPATMRVKVGEEVAWVNKGSTSAREITADQEDAPGLDSTGPLAEGDTYIYTFEKKGTVNYYDPSNPTVFKGTIIVE